MRELEKIFNQAATAEIPPDAALAELEKVVATLENIACIQDLRRRIKELKRKSGD